MTFDEKLHAILTNYEFQVIAQSDDDTGEQQMEVAKKALKDLILKEVIGSNSRKAQNAYLTHSNDFAAVVVEKEINKRLKQQRAIVNGRDKMQPNNTSEGKNDE